MSGYIHVSGGQSGCWDGLAFWNVSRAFNSSLILLMMGKRDISTLNLQRGRNQGQENMYIPHPMIIPTVPVSIVHLWNQAEVSHGYLHSNRNT